MPSSPTPTTEASKSTSSPSPSLYISIRIRLSVNSVILLPSQVFSGCNSFVFAFYRSNGGQAFKTYYFCSFSLLCFSKTELRFCLPKTQDLPPHQLRHQFWRETQSLSSGICDFSWVSTLFHGSCKYLVVIMFSLAHCCIFPPCL